MGEAAAEAPPDCHPQVYLTSIAQKYNLKGVFYIDLWPISTPMVVLIEPSIMTQVQVTNVLPMHPMSEDFMKPIVGPDNIASSNGAVWKLMHNNIAPAFSWSHIRNLSAVVIDECDTFRSRLDVLAETEKTFSMETVGSQLVFDVIARIVYSFSLNAQRKGSQDLEDLRGMVKLAHVQLSWNPISKFKAIFQRRALFRRLGVSVSTQIQQRLKVLTDDQIVPHRKNPHSILDLMLREHLAQEDSAGNKKNSTELSPEYMKLLITK
jgi:cytochrome P450